MKKIEVYSYKGNRVPRWLKVLLALIGAGILAFALLLGLVLTGSYDHISGDPQVMIILAVRCARTAPPSSCRTAWMRPWTIWRTTRT